MTPADHTLTGRVAVLGSPGSGKSTFCHGLGRCGVPLFHLDDLYWLPGWQRPSDEEWRRTVALLAADKRWIMDGNHLATVPERLARAEIVVLLDLPVLVCAWQVVRRSIRLRRRGAACDEYLPRGLRPGDPPVRDLWALLRKVLGFRRRELVGMRRMLEGFPGRTIICGSRREVAAAQRELTALLGGCPPVLGAWPSTHGMASCTCGGRTRAAMTTHKEDQ